MAIGATFVLVCDGCQRTHEIGFEVEPGRIPRGDANDTARALGWRTRRPGYAERTRHYCPPCAVDGRAR